LKAEEVNAKDAATKQRLKAAVSQALKVRSSGFLVGRWVDEVKAGEHQVEGPVLRIPIPS
jgi:hypothetical protein